MKPSNFINPDTGVLHRSDCHAARHLKDGVTKTYHAVGKTLSGRVVTERVPQKPSAIAEGVMIAWLSLCKVCKPEQKQSDDQEWA